MLSHPSLAENNDNKQLIPLQQQTPHFWKTPRLVRRRPNGKFGVRGNAASINAHQNLNNLYIS